MGRVFANSLTFFLRLLRLLHDFMSIGAWFYNFIASLILLPVKYNYNSMLNTQCDEGVSQLVFLESGKVLHWISWKLFFKLGLLRRASFDHHLCVVYLTRTWKLAELIFSAVFNLFIDFKPFLVISRLKSTYRNGF